MVLQLQASNKINSIQILRGIAALAVVAFHTRGDLNQYAQTNLGDLLFKSGEAGVYLFFVISGFIISFATRKIETPKEYIIKRFFRIYPIYIVCLILMMLVYSEQYTISNKVKALLLLPLDPHAEGPFYGYTILGVAWTLTYEVFFYFSFLIAMLINYKYRALFSSLIIILAVFLGNYFIFGNVGFNPHTPPVLGGTGLHYYFIYMTNPILLNFVLGMLAEFVYSKANINNQIINRLIKSIAPIVAIFSLWALMTPRDLIGDMQWAIPSFGLVLSLCLLEKVGVNFEFKRLIALGAISYSIYLIHMVIMLTLRLDLFKIFWPTGFSKFISLILLTIFISKILYDYIEKPSQQFARYLCKK